MGIQLGKQFMPPYQCIGVVRGDAFVAGALFNNFDWPNIEITFVTTTPRWASRQVIGRIFAYPFCELGCRRLTAITGARNETARVFLERLGFGQEGIHPDLFEHDDGISYGLLKRDALKWLEISHVESTKTAGASGSVHDEWGGIEGQHSSGDRERSSG